MRPNVCKILSILQMWRFSFNLYSCADWCQLKKQNHDFLFIKIRWKQIIPPIKEVILLWFISLRFDNWCISLTLNTKMWFNSVMGNPFAVTIYWVDEHQLVKKCLNFLKTKYLLFFRKCILHLGNNGTLATLLMGAYLIID